MSEDGRSADADGLLPSVEPIPVSPPDGAAIPSAGNTEPDWFEVAKGMANAIMFQRSTRGEHVVGRDGRVRMGVVDLFGCYAVDTAAREFCEMAGLPFGKIDAPNEHQAMFMSVTGQDWTTWFTDRESIIAAAGESPGRGKVDLNAIAQAISTGTVKTAQPVEGEACERGPQGCAQTVSGDS